ncbi:MAG: glycosyltransferase family 2 protein [Lachnospiraceae bacterium]|nr:glycosyltransferase family 2 protein [Lachnospiraceae bacterium]
MNDICFSILIPAYNAKSYVEDAVNSVLVSCAGLRGRDRAVEILIVDDGSVDGTGQLADTIALNNSSEECVIRVIHQENRGHGGAINAGVEEINGGYFMVLDADDAVASDGIKSVCETAADSTPDLMILGEDRWYEDSDIVESYRVPEELLGSDMDAGRKLTDLKFVTDNWNTELRYLFNMHCMVFNTAFFRSLNIKLPEKVYYDDAYYFIVAAAYAKSVMLEHGLLYRYRLGNPNQSVSVENRVKRLSQHERVIDSIMAEYPNVQKAGDSAFFYYRLRLCGVVTDYLVTALLRCDDRAYGRKSSKLMMKKFKNIKIPKLVRNYLVLRGMNLMHMGEKQFGRLIGRK